LRLASAGDVIAEREGQEAQIFEPIDERQLHDRHLQKQRRFPVRRGEFPVVLV
jgi:hypothetical protein